MSEKLENYISFLRHHHLPKITKFFIKQTTENHFTSIKENKETKAALSDEFKQLLKSIEKKSLIKDSKNELLKLRKEFKDAAIDDNRLVRKYITFLKNNKLALIHYLPLYSDDIQTSVELTKEIEILFTQLELDIISELGTGAALNKVKGEKIEIINTTKQELKKTTKDLEISEKQLLETQKIAHVGSFIWNAATESISVSKEFYNIFQINPKTAITLDLISNNLDEDSKKLLKINTQYALEKPGIYEKEYKLILDNNQEKYILIRYESIGDSKGIVKEIVGLLMDITSIKRSEIELNKKNKEINKANNKLEKTYDELKISNEELDNRVKERTKELNEANERYRSFIKISTEGIWRYALKDFGYLDINLPVEDQIEILYNHAYIAECNDKLAIIHGLQDAKEVIGSTFYQNKFSSSSEEERKDFLKNFIEKGYKISNLYSEEKSEDGKIIYLQTSMVGTIEDNKLIDIWGIQRDVTEKTIAENLLKRSEERYRFLAENIPLIFWTARPDGYLDYGNKEWFKYTGSTPKDFETEDWHYYVHPEDVERIDQEWDKSIQTGKVFQAQYRLKNLRGNYHWHLGRAFPLKNEYGRIIKWMGTSTDIHEQKKYSDKLDTKNKELSRINNELDNLIYTVSHDLKSPVANIEGLLTALKESIPDSTISEEGLDNILKMMNDSVEKFKKNLSEVIDIAKAQKRGEETSEDNNLNDIVEDVLPDLEIMIKERGAQINTDFKECSHIHFNKKNLRSIFYNLMSNAIKYSSPDRTPEVNISSKETEEYKILIVEDNGKGIESSHLDQLTSKRLYKEIEGSGVGLYILKRIMDNSGGKIELASEKGVGSKFSIYFPITNN